jgi:hypothetical protein
LRRLPQRKLRKIKKLKKDSGKLKTSGLHTVNFPLSSRSPQPSVSGAGVRLLLLHNYLKKKVAAGGHFADRAFPVSPPNGGHCHADEGSI